MEEQILLNNQLPQNRVIFQPKKSIFPLVISVLFVLSSVLSGFLIYQNIQLQKQVLKLSSDASKDDSAKSVFAKDVDQFAGWKTYTNTQFMYEFKYPSTGNILSIKPRDDLFVGGDGFYLNYNDDKFRPQKSEIYVHVYKGRDKRLETWLRENSTGQPFGSDVDKEFYGYLEFGKSSLLGLPAIKFRHVVMGYITHNIAVEKNGFIFIIGNIEVAEDLSKEYDQILSTFKFIK